MTNKQVFRVHPAINFARVGNSEEFYIAPESMAGIPTKKDQTQLGGLPIKPDSNDTLIDSQDIRDASGALKRQAARFRIFAYDETDLDTYPSGEGKEIKINSKVNGKKVVDIRWMVHIANKKANSFVLEWEGHSAEPIIDNYKNKQTPPLRNFEEFPFLPDDPKRVMPLTIDPGPRVVHRKSPLAGLDHLSTATYLKGDTPTSIESYPKLFPGLFCPCEHCDNKAGLENVRCFKNLYMPMGTINTLGALRMEKNGRLLVLPGFGRSASWNDPLPPNMQPVDNDGWFDDTGDGPVHAVVCYDDGTYDEVVPGWVVSTDPAYAPQTLNTVSLWDSIYDTFVRELKLEPELYQGGSYQPDYTPSFYGQVFPVFQSAALQRWNTNLPDIAIKAHDAIGKIGPTDKPENTLMAGLAFIRDPNQQQEDLGAPLMPLSLGDSGQPFLSLTRTQYFLLQQWNDKKAMGKEARKFDEDKLGAGEYLDKAALINCLGGRFSPGIDMTFIVNVPDLWVKNWATSGKGPFRINAKKIDYARAERGELVLGGGWIPYHNPSPQGQIEPGDTSKFMSIPWHTDYNSCAIHTTDPNPQNNQTLYWSWPAQRPVHVYLAREVQNGELGQQRYSVRGPGTEPDTLITAGAYQNYYNMLTNWTQVGVIMQGKNIIAEKGKRLPQDALLEAQGLLDVVGISPKPWPMMADEAYQSEPKPQTLNGLPIKPKVKDEV